MGLRNLHTDNSHQKLTNLLSSQLHKTPEKVVRNLNLVYEIQSLARKHPIKNHSKESPKTEATSQQYKVCVCARGCARDPPLIKIIIQPLKLNCTYYLQIELVKRTQLTKIWSTLITHQIWAISHAMPINQLCLLIKISNRLWVFYCVTNIRCLFNENCKSQYTLAFSLHSWLQKATPFPWNSVEVNFLRQK